jgi:hypothetical protein
MIESLTIIKCDGRNVFLHSTCGTELQRKPGDPSTVDKPWVLHCPKCRAVAAEWDSRDEREIELGQWLRH